MEIIKTQFEGLFIIQHKVFKDDRGLFVKTYNQDIFKELDLEFKTKERYYSVSNQNVIRGMHFQTPPKDHIKLVTVINGKILDVVLDIRKSSPTYGQCFSIELKSEEGKTIYIPKGFAHGFSALEENTIVEYNQTASYAPDNDTGIRYDSFGFDWKISAPIISDRDNSLRSFKKFTTPF